MADPIDPITANPDPDNPSTFNAQAVLAWQQLIARIPQMNTAFLALNFNSTNSVSTTSDTIARESTTITVEASKSYVVGMTVKIAYTTDATNWMEGEVTAYNSGTGALTVNVRRIHGSGTYAAWTVSQAAAVVDVGDHEVTLRGGSGYGSTRTVRRRFTTVQRNVGTAISYTDTAANGLECTINEDGEYTIVYRDESGNSSQAFGVVLNNTQYTTSINSVTVGEIKSFAITSAINVPVQQTVTLRLSAGDVIAPHTTGAATPGTSEIRVYFSIVKTNN